MSVEFYRESPGKLTQGLLIGKLLIGGLGVAHLSHARNGRLQIRWSTRQRHLQRERFGNVCIYIYIYREREMYVCMYL